MMYTGALGQTIIDDIQSNGGILSMEDIASYETKRRDVVRGTYRGHEILAVPPTSAGGTHIVQMLNILEEWDIAAMGFGSPDAVHVTAEALRIAFADRFVHMGDPDAGEIPVDWLTSKSYAAERRAEIDMARAGEYIAGTPQFGEGSHPCFPDSQLRYVCASIPYVRPGLGLSQGDCHPWVGCLIPVTTFPGRPT